MSKNYLINLAYELREIMRACCYGISNLESLQKTEMKNVGRTDHGKVNLYSYINEIDPRIKYHHSSK